jgi:hypothetical protein
VANFVEKWNAQYNINEQCAQNSAWNTKEWVTKETKPSKRHSFSIHQIPYSAFWKRNPNLAVGNEIQTVAIKKHDIVSSY